MRRACFTTILVACALAAHQISAQSSGQPSGRTPTAFRSGVDLISLNVTVTDPARRFVTNLEQSAFVVLEDGRPQAVTFFSQTGLPLDIAVVIDTSASMQGALEAAQEAAVGFIQRMRPDDRAAVVDFDGRVRILQPFTGDQKALERAVRSTVADGSTALYNAVYISLKELAKLAAAGAEQPRRQAIVLLSDGEDTSSLMQFEDVVDLADRSNTAIYTVGLGTRDATGHLDKHGAEFALRRLASQSGGRAFFPTEMRQLPSIYSDIRDDLASQYALAYASTNGRRDGQWRRVTIRMEQRDLTARTKPGYFGPR